MNIYLKIDFATGMAYQYSKVATEGYESHTSKLGNVSFRKYYKTGVYGTYRGITIRENEFDGKKMKEISVSLRNKDNENIYLNIPLLDAKKSITDFAESVIAHLPSLVAGAPYRVYPYNFKEDGQKYSTIGVSFKHANLEAETFDKEIKIERLKKTFIKRDGTIIAGDIPAIIFEKDFDDSFTKNSKERDRYLYNLLEAKVGEAVAEAETSVAATPAPVTPVVPTSVPKVDVKAESGDLPF